jgi:hypothetical protein
MKARMKLPVFVSLMMIATLILAAAVYASDVEIVAVVDIISPTNSVELSSGESSEILISIKASGAQVGTSTFKINGGMSRVV